MILDFINKYMFLLFAIVFTISRVYSDRNKIKKIKSLFSNTNWITHLSVLILFTLGSLIFSPEGSKEIIATKKAFVAFIIALFASLDLTIAPFWVIWILSYSFDTWA